MYYTDKVLLLVIRVLLKFLVMYECWKNKQTILICQSWKTSMENLFPYIYFLIGVLCCTHGCFTFTKRGKPTTLRRLLQVIVMCGHAERKPAWAELEPRSPPLMGSISLWSLFLYYLNEKLLCLLMCGMWDFEAHYSEKLPWEK